MSDNTQRRPYVTTVERFDVSSTEQTVTVRKLKTRKGERIEFESPADGSTLTVDALGLESLAWQESDIFAAYLSSEYDFEPLNEDAEEVVCDIEFELMNEYAHVRVRRLRSPERVVLEIRAPKKRERIQINSNGLRGLVQQDHTIFSEFLTQPHGPDDH